MENQVILYSAENEIATITLNRPNSLNSMNETLVNELFSALQTAEDTNDVRVIILTGSGRAFCAGGDLSHLETLQDVVSAQNFITKVGKLVEKIMSLTKPIIAMVNGIAAGAGFNLALACDILYCAKSARFAQSFAKVGLVPDCGGMYLLPRIIGLHKAKELMFTADIIDSATADKFGLINKVIADEALRSETYAFAEKLKNSAPLAIHLIKQTLNHTDTLTLQNLLDHEAALQTLCMQTSDHKEGLLAFKEKRTPIFTGK